MSPEDWECVRAAIQTRDSLGIRAESWAMMTDYMYIADVFTRILASAIIGVGVFALFKPVEGARQFGGDGVADYRHTTFVTPLFARNISIGLSILLLSLQGERKAVGTILGTIVLVGFADLWWCLEYARSRLVTHAVGTVMFGGLSWVMLR
ncbi:hypothetical protein LTR53_010029 [Teratosphaeriaceae sp. CCFEE 6253]|nr:hypothetical protein LTR53_010029 [Teratosphaeriaceae sp. CCFEE 6253]